MPCRMTFSVRTRKSWFVSSRAEGSAQDRDSNLYACPDIFLFLFRFFCFFASLASFSAFRAAASAFSFCFANSAARAAASCFCFSASRAAASRFCLSASQAAFCFSSSSAAAACFCLSASRSRISCLSRSTSRSSAACLCLSAFRARQPEAKRYLPTPYLGPVLPVSASIWVVGAEMTATEPFGLGAGGDNLSVNGTVVLPV